MKKIINQPEQVLVDMLAGYKLVHDDVTYLEDTHVITRAQFTSNKVGIISGGGSGHEPAHAGFVGLGMLDAAVCGHVFTSPTPDQVFSAIKAADQGSGVFLVIKNYSGDCMNFEMAKDLAELEGIAVDYVIVNDDVAVFDSSYTEGRRGVAGTILVHKIIGAAAEKGASLEDIKTLAESVVAHLATVGVAIKPAIVPEVGKPGFDLDEDEMEFGIGIHGEPGYSREKIKTSREIAEELIHKIEMETKWTTDQTLAVLINGMGATPLMEQYIFAHDCLNILQEKGYKVQFKKVGNYMTAIDMAGVSLTLLQLEDPKWLEYLTESTLAPAW
ncbi:dihydroxyacetone kinase subunit DhaK [Viridibacillus sp. FSL R5-0477]|uniref:Dihydroxyacetone kinase, DhaK subunit n=1 Tax=Viridibacillus arenosi FSL R5-213 TaxID=1227360 RepID=W4F1W0_9BACL|nr:MULTISPECIES: dihydroxyacetone kinase subunit DhaK [Viridibacillus]ETT86444.1 dihydroxyacetone kinase, DhaK subunit [Viridibacillus arenosi FSL R5-213]OMC84675.1 dihydroxyacetone kinase subunit DhaK [Viridibacillus sp. FSL H8-0123]OMC86092.1 dihydroxyacetone kinase subunit DhaK [Viridibacillus sp. FSL H7-0596]OMC91721.1 dihydroxyacetone kinase subunit DhaK [Viridibacillus arenosi]